MFEPPSSEWWEEEAPLEGRREWFLVLLNEMGGADAD